MLLFEERENKALAKLVLLYYVGLDLYLHYYNRTGHIDMPLELGIYRVVYIK